MRLAKDLRKKIRDHINRGFIDALKNDFGDKFALGLESSYNIFAMSLISTREDGIDFTSEQAAFIHAYEEGYTAAMNRLDEPARPAKQRNAVGTERKS